MMSKEKWPPRLVFLLERLADLLVEFLRRKSRTKTGTGMHCAHVTAS